MENMIIYYQIKENENIASAVNYLDTLIKEVETLYSIKGVYIDNYDSDNELFELLETPLKGINYLLLINEPNDEFSKTLLQQLARTEKFKICFTDEIPGLKSND